MFYVLTQVKGISGHYERAWLPQPGFRLTVVDFMPAFMITGGDNVFHGPRSIQSHCCHHSPKIMTHLKIIQCIY